MVKYYVKITQKQPSDEDDSVWFELESGSDEKGEFFALRRNEYDDLVNQFNTIEQKFEDEYVQPIVEEKANQYIGGLTSVPNSTNSENLINPNDPTQKHNWNSLTSNFSTIYNSLANMSTDLANKVDTNTVTSLQSSVNSKAPSNHTHSDWKKVTLGSYCTGYYNSAIRIFAMRYAHSDYNFTKTSTIKIHSGLFKNYKPLTGNVILPMYNAEMGGYIDDATGDMYVYSRNTGKKSISTSAMWRY